MIAQGEAIAHGATGHVVKNDAVTALFYERQGQPKTDRAQSITF